MVRRRGTLPAALLLCGAAACATPAFVPPPFEPEPAPPPGAVTAVVFLVGDAGDLPRERSAVLHRLRTDVEEWSAALPDGATTVLYLGDNVYPVGVRDPGSPDFPADSARLAGQVWAATGPESSARGTRVRFLPGNHDWGNTTGATGVARLQNQADLLERLAPGVTLSPPPGDPGPTVLDVGSALRMVLLDTHWWLQSDQADRKERVLDGLRRALREAGDRPTVVAAHHPLATGGPHGGGIVDPFFLLRKAGAVIQDLNAAPFEELRAGLSRAFRESNRPLVFVGGHDHSLQVLNTAGPGSPAWSLVSGAGSKLSPVADAPGLRWAGSRPGYMRLVVSRDGGVRLFVEAAPDAPEPCEATAPECLARAAGAFSTVYSVRLR